MSVIVCVTGLNFAITHRFHATEQREVRLTLHTSPHSITCPVDLRWWPSCKLFSQSSSPAWPATLT